MNYLAFDVSKGKLDGVLTNLKSKEEYFQIENNEESIRKWISGFKFPKKVTIGYESTAGYHLLLGKLLKEEGHVSKMINPIVTKQFTRSTVRKKKIDMSDSLVIAKLLAQGEGYQISDDSLEKIESRMMKKLSEKKMSVHLMRNSLKYHENTEYLDKRLEDIEKYMESVVSECYEYFEEKYSKEEDIKLLMSITGIGFKTAFVIWSELGDIERFNSPKQIVAYAGLDPKIRQSGHCLDSKGKLTKRGSPYLRQSIFITANVARMFDPELKRYYEKKRNEGKKHTVAVCAVSRKMISRIYAVLKRKSAFVKRGIDER